MSLCGDMDVKTVLSGMSQIQCHAEGTYYLSFFFQTDRCQGSSLQNMRQHDSLDDGHVPAGTSKLLKDFFGGETEEDEAWQ